MGSRGLTLLTCVLAAGCIMDGTESDRTGSGLGYEAGGLAVPVVPTTVRAGGVHTCAVQGGGVRCWGAHDLGELGIGFFLNGATPPGCRIAYGALQCDSPVSVPGLTSGVLGVATGFAFSCALKSDGTVVCWGSNLYGQLGIGTAVPAGCVDTGSPTVGVYCASPQKALGLTGVTQIVANDFSMCARKADGTAACWGLNMHGELGLGTTKPAGCTGTTTEGMAMKCTKPVAVPGLAGVKRVESGGGYHACAVLTSGAVKCWGLNMTGELGIGATLPAGCHDLDGDGIASMCPMPMTVVGLSGATDIAVGSFHSCASLSNGTAKCWGQNESGRLGIGKTVPAGCYDDIVPDGMADYCRLPAPVKGLTNVKTVAAGWLRSCAILTTGELRCWGSDDRKALGIGDTVPPQCVASGIPYCPEPVAITGLTGAVSNVATNEMQTCASLAAGGAMCWGMNGYGDLGLGKSVPPTCVDTDGDGYANRCSRPASVTGL